MTKELEEQSAAMQPKKKETDINETLQELADEMGTGDKEAIEDITQSRKIF